MCVVDESQVHEVGDGGYEHNCQARNEPRTRALPYLPKTLASSQALSTQPYPLQDDRNMAERPFITCHVLDTIIGKPGVGIECALEAIDYAAGATPPTWKAMTNNDGRVAAWDNLSGGLNEYIAERKSKLAEGEHVVLRLRFFTGSYFGYDKTFYPEVAITFSVKKEEEHYHLPLLLGPWSYTTYRGS
ncbi:uncharacterized protein LTR77_006762 [Saxophila tyrrhenica]|uniref:hydroxyisourate hydrolase n=1 Tax=Saxophila tyrrhenica TaxID=1690608 RepID=A0AAV9P8M2_9PEZI|nr:hypothetical protein LTR77_006762 [Saxophila tyrrhenica]